MMSFVFLKKNQSVLRSSPKRNFVDFFVVFFQDRQPVLFLLKSVLWLNLTLVKFYECMYSSTVVVYYSV